MKYGIAGAIVCLLLASGFLGMASTAAPSEPYEQVEIERGTTDILGGGNYVFLKFGNWDAAFGVMWGTNDTPNSIIMVAIQARYIGMADAYDANGAKVAGRLPVKIYTIYAVKLEDIFEFNDTNGNGICDYIRVADGLDYGDYIMHEPIYKGVSLETAWTDSDARSFTDPVNKTKNYEITLTAEDLPYRPIGKNINTSGALDKVQFRFRLKAGLVHVENATLPHYDVTVDKVGGQYQVVDAQRTGTVTVSGDVGKYAVKWDHLFEGWDFDPTNVNRSLLMEFHALVGNYIPAGVVQGMKALTSTGETGDVEYSTETGDVRLPGEAYSNPMWENRMPSRLKMPRVEFLGNWTRIGRLTWVSDVEVDGKDAQMYAQVQGGRRIGGYLPEGSAYTGFALLGGLSYPGGASIYHDPTVEADMLLVSQKRSIPVGLVLLVGVAVVVTLIVGVLAYAKVRGLGPFRQRFEDTYDRKRPSGPSRPDWEKHYPK